MKKKNPAEGEKSSKYSPAKILHHGEVVIFSCNCRFFLCVFICVFYVSSFFFEGLRCIPPPPESSTKRLEGLAPVHPCHRGAGLVQPGGHQRRAQRFFAVVAWGPWNQPTPGGGAPWGVDWAHILGVVLGYIKNSLCTPKKNREKNLSSMGIHRNPSWRGGQTKTSASNAGDQAAFRRWGARRNAQSGPPVMDAPWPLRIYNSVSYFHSIGFHNGALLLLLHFLDRTIAFFVVLAGPSRV